MKQPARIGLVGNRATRVNHAGGLRLMGAHGDIFTACGNWIKRRHVLRGQGTSAGWRRCQKCNWRGAPAEG